MAGARQIRHFSPNADLFPKSLHSFVNKSESSIFQLSALTLAVCAVS